MFELLEPRLLLDGALPVGPGFLLNNPAGAYQHDLSVAMDADGDSLVVSGDYYGYSGIFGQFFDSAGNLNGPIAELVSAESNQTMTDVSVAIDADGDFVIVWRMYDVYVMESAIIAQRFAADGETAGSEIIVASQTLVLMQDEPDVAMDADGNFMVVWQEGEYGYGEGGIIGTFFNANGTTTGTQYPLVSAPADTLTRDASVAMDDDGNFVLVWEEYYDGAYPTPDSQSILAQRFLADGTVIGSPFIVAADSGGAFPVLPENPAVAMDADGDFRILWQEGYGYTGLLGAAFNSAGTQQGPAEIIIDAPSSPTFFSTAMAMDADGDFIVGWSMYLDSANQIMAQRFAADGAPQRSPFYIVTPSLDSGYDSPSVAIDPSGDTLITWTGYYGQTSVLGQYFDSAGAPISPVFQFVYGDQNTEIDMPAMAMDADGDFVITWDQYDNYGDQKIFAQQFTAGGSAAGDEMLISDLPGDWYNPAVGMEPDGDFMVVWQSGYSGFGGLWAQRFDSFGLPQSPIFRPVTSHASDPAVAVDASGDFVIAWEDNDYLSESVLVQAFDADGTPRSPLIMTDEDEEDSAVAIDPNGNFLVLSGKSRFEEDSAPNYLFARRFTMDGDWIDEGLVLATNGGNGFLTPAVAFDTSGEFVIAWAEMPEYGSDQTSIMTQRFGPDLMPIQPKQIVAKADNDGDSAVENPSIAMDADGNFLIVRHDYDADSGIVGQFFDAGGRATSGLMLLVEPESDIGNGNYLPLRDPRVAMDDTGDFVIVWERYDQNNYFATLMARLFSATGMPAGMEFVVTAIADSQSTDHDVAMDGDGNFLVVWDDYDAYTYTETIHGQRYSAAGIPQGATIDLVTSPPDEELHDPRVSMDADGDLVVLTWTQYNNSSYETDLHANIYNFGPATTPDASILVASGQMDLEEGLTDVAMDSDGDFAVMWSEYDDYSYTWNTIVQQFDSAGVLVGSQLDIAQNTSEAPDVSIAMDAAGDFVVAWSDYTPYGTNLLGQRFEGPLAVLIGDIAPVGNPDGIVDGADLGALLARWKDTGDSIADIAPVATGGDGIVDGADLGALLARWKNTIETTPAPTPAITTVEPAIVVVDAPSPSSTPTAPAEMETPDQPAAATDELAPLATRPIIYGKHGKYEQYEQYEKASYHRNASVEKGFDVLSAATGQFIAPQVEANTERDSGEPVESQPVMRITDIRAAARVRAAKRIGKGDLDLVDLFEVLPQQLRA